MYFDNVSLFSFYPQDSDVGETHCLIRTTEPVHLPASLSTGYIPRGAKNQVLKSGKNERLSDLNVSHKLCRTYLLAASIIIALMMEAANTSETSVNFYQTTRRYNQKDSHLQGKQ
jgi:hypothetical protein